jgi:hypothetical protein
MAHFRRLRRLKFHEVIEKARIKLGKRLFGLDLEKLKWK